MNDSIEKKTRNRRRDLCRESRRGRHIAATTTICHSSILITIVLLLYVGAYSEFHKHRLAFGFVPRIATIDKTRIKNERRSIIHPLQGQPRTKQILSSSQLGMVASAEAPANETMIHIDTETAATTSTIESDLRALGWEAHFSNQVSSEDESDSNLDCNNGALIPVRITEVRSKSIHVVGAGGIDHLIPVTQGQKIINGNEEKVVVAGDWILVEDTTTSDGNSENERTLRIRKVLNRRSVIKRKAPGRNNRRKQLIASNLNTVFVVSSCNQDFNIARLERYIAMVLETENVEPVVVLTKKDLLMEMGDMDDDLDNAEEESSSMDLELVENIEDSELEDEDDFDEDDFDEEDASSWLLDYYVGEAGAIAGGTIPVVCLDARNGQEASELLQPWLGEGQTVAFVGSSGVGKSTLVNSLCGFELVKTGDIHTDSGQGRHTTTRRQLHFLNPSGKSSCAILDTPGLRELQLVEAAQGLDLVFQDLVDLSKQCKFNDCTHSGEPGCAIDAALESGLIEVERVARWEKLVAEDALNTKDVEEGRIERERKKNRKKKSLASSKKSRRKSVQSD